MLVFLRMTGIDQIAGEQNHIGLLLQGKDFLDAAGQHRSSVDPAVGKLARLLDMGIGDLCDQHAETPRNIGRPHGSSAGQHLPPGAVTHLCFNHQ